MTFKFGRLGFFSAVLAVALSALGCSGGSGSSGVPTPSGNGAGTPGGQTPGAPDLSPMLVGRWQGALFGDSYGQIRHNIEFRADGTCDWTDEFDDFFGRDKLGWAWAVSGADSHPDWDQPWLVQMRPPPGDEMLPFTLRIVLIDEQGFTLRDWIEGKDVMFEMTRVQ